MPDLSCPSCGGIVPLRRAALAYAVCPYCQSLLLRDGADLRAVGKSAVLPFDVSPILIGTRGTVDHKGFEVIGRVRWGWRDGSWNEWMILLDDGSTRWLAEAMGTFMVLAEAPQARALPLIQGFAQGGAIAPGAQVVIDGIHFTAADVKQATCLGGEGQLPFATPADWTVTSVDFRTTTGAVLSVQRDAHETGAWVGRYVDLVDLAPSGLRRFDDWAMPEGLQ
jgi:hypothetical protein